MELHKRYLPGHLELGFAGGEQLPGNLLRGCVHHDVPIDHLHVLGDEVPSNHCAPVVRNEGKLLTTFDKKQWTC